MEVTALVTEVEAPFGESEQFLQGGSTISDLQATGTDVAWYGSVTDAAGGINELSPSEILITGTIYHATQTINGCESDNVLSVAVSLITGIETNTFGLQAYPNPVKDRFRISLDRKIDQLVAVNNLGQPVFRQSIKAYKAEIDFSAMASGMYAIQLQVADRVITFRVLKQ